MSALDLLSDWSSFTHISISDKQWQEGNTRRYYYRHPTDTLQSLELLLAGMT